MQPEAIVDLLTAIVARTLDTDGTLDGVQAALDDVRDTSLAVLLQQANTSLLLPGEKECPGCQTVFKSGKPPATCGKCKRKVIQLD